MPARRRLTHFIRVLWLLATGPAAFAGTPTVLPDTQSATAWEQAFELSGLSRTTGPCSHCILIEDTGSRWTIRAQGRTVMVDAPVDETQRRNIAVLARSLGREWGARPPPVVMSAPPSPPTTTAPSSEVVALRPTPAPHLAKVPRPSGPDTPVADVAHVAPELPPYRPHFAYPGTARPIAANEPSAAPPLWFSIGASLRPGVGPAPSLAAGIDLIRAGRLSVGVTADVVGTRVLRTISEHGPLSTQWQSATGLVGAWSPSRRIRVDVVALAAVHAYRSDFRSVGLAVRPQLGVAAEWHTRRTRAVGLRLAVRSDLMPSVIQNDGRAPTTRLSVVEANASVVIRLGDPSTSVSTPVRVMNTSPDMNWTVAP